MSHPLNLRLCFYHLPRLVTALLLLLFFVGGGARAAVQEAPPGAAELSFIDPHSGDTLQAVVQSSRAQVDITGMIATVHLSQRFRNDSDQWREALYSFPLPEGAAVRAMEMVIGGRRIVGKVREKVAARQAYQQARTEGRRASLVEQHRPNLFSNRVANIGPGQVVEVSLEYVQMADYDHGRFSLRLPTTLTPRYMPGVPLAPALLPGETQANPLLGWAPATSDVPDAALISPLLLPQAGDDHQPLNSIEIEVSLDPGIPLAEVSALYHEIQLSRSKGVYEVALVAGRAEMNRDFVLQWRPAAGSEPQVAAFTETVGGERYALLMVLPPSLPAPAAPRDVTFVIDTSGSMGGEPIRQARQALDLALQQLRPGERFNVIAFNSGYRALHPMPVPASAHYVAAAREFVRHLQAGGGTEMRAALAAAMRSAKGEGGEHSAVRQIVFITDGAVGNEQGLYQAITEDIGSARLFTVAIGAAPNTAFMRRAAAFGRGSFTSIGTSDEVARRMRELFDKLSSPVLTELQLDFEGKRESELWPQRLPDLYRGEPLLLSARLAPGAVPARMTVSGSSNGQHWQRQVPLAADGPSRAGVASLWARRKIRGLLDSRFFGATAETVRAAVLPLALQHQLLSPFTSFLAQEEHPARPSAIPLRKTPVANTRPLGQSPQTFAYPQTATTGPARLWFGTLFLFIALLVYVMGRPECDRD